MKHTQNILYLLVLTLFLSSCSDKNSLHNYILTNAEKTGFSSIGVPKSLLKPEGVELTNKQQEAFDAVERINVLAYRIDDKNKENYSAERKKVKEILKQDKYEELINMGASGVIKYAGTENSIDEIVIFGSRKEIGFVVARIIGDDMSVEKFMELYKFAQQGNYKEADFSQLTNFFK